ncbi:MAG: tRNA (adenosine(37)-N6)-threonylcarbamoyltransferase complex ATPase subunit type 1 TsaE [Patescibacteria group bacterium]
MITTTTQETEKIAAEVAAKVKNGGIVCLFGDLGSGKTTFTKGIAEYFGLDKFSIKSPTYTYIRQYPNKNNRIYHMDLYRLEVIDELLWQEIKELMVNKNNILIIEWADKMEDYLPGNRIDVHFKYLDENSREITIDL